MPNTSSGLDLPRRRRGFSVVPFFGDLLAMWRMVRDPRAAGWTKVLALAAIAYVACPIDAIPDVAPLLSWLDDVGIVIALRVALYRYLAIYRYPLFEAPTRADQAPALPAVSPLPGRSTPSRR